MLSVGLVHHPVIDSKGDVVTTNVTNFDIHDIARACQVYGVKNYFIINPMREQLMFVMRILDHWRVGYGAQYNPMRRTALEPVKTAESIEEAVRTLAADSGKVTVVGTSARNLPEHQQVSFKQLRQDLASSEENYLLLFGTGFGMHEDALKQCQLILEPIKGASPQDYRHLSVRSAVSICLDRLKGTW